jgi:hypothetical protein
LRRTDLGMNLEDEASVIVEPAAEIGGDVSSCSV